MSTISRRQWFFPAAAAFLLAAVSPARSHHASSLDYLEDTTGTVEGVVDDIFWANPHIHLYLTVTRDDGSTEVWDIEGPNLSSLSRLGVGRDSIGVGDTIAVSGPLGRDGRRRLWADSIIRNDGTVIMGRPD